MSSIRRVARAIKQQDKETVENKAREIEYADVKRVNPISAELHGSGIGLDEEDDLTLSQWVRTYHSAVGIDPGDTLAVKQMRSGKWLVTDIINAQAPLLPTGGVPNGGTTGQVLRKVSNTNGDVEWGTVSGGSPELPSGGTTNQVLSKASNTTGDVNWRTILEVPSGGTTGQVLKKASSTSGDFAWSADETGSSELPSGGTTGQVLKKASNTTGDVVWGTDETGGGGGGDTPSGAILAWPTASAPTGWLLCDGQSLSTTTYADLFAVVGYTYGGSGSTFNLPNMKGRVPVGVDSAQTEFDTLGETGGAKTHTLTSSEMPAHTHDGSALSTNSTGSHSHGVGTLATASDGSHTHGVGTLATASGGSHTHGVGTLATNTTGGHDHGLSGGSHSHTVNGHTHDISVAYAQAANTVVSTTATGNRSNLDGTGSTRTYTSTSASPGTDARTPAIKMDSAGSHSHTLSGATASDGSHTHTLSGATASDGSHTHTMSGSTASDGSHSHTVSGSTGSSGSGSAHANLQPYITLNYIIKA